MQRDNGFFGSWDPFSSLGGFGLRGSLLSGSFGGRDPFDDPFFTRPLRSIMGSSIFGPSIFHSEGSLFGESSNAGFLGQQPLQRNRRRIPIVEESEGNLSGESGDAGVFEQQPLQQERRRIPIVEESEGNLSGESGNARLLEQQPIRHNRRRVPIIQELSSDNEEGGDNNDKEKSEDTVKDSTASITPYVVGPDEETEAKEKQYRNDYNRSNRAQPQACTYSFEKKIVTYGGINGAYYTSSTTKRISSDGVTVEERKEADKTTGKATHRISRGIHDKGHSLTRKLNSDGSVDTMQALHNLNEDELPAFEEAWEGSAGQHLPGWKPGHCVHDDAHMRRSSSSKQGEQQSDDEQISQQNNRITEEE